jgi:hypothetical protein
MKSSQFDGTDGILGILDDASEAGALVTFEFLIEVAFGASALSSRRDGS